MVGIAQAITGFNMSDLRCAQSCTDVDDNSGHGVALELPKNATHFKNISIFVITHKGHLERIFVGNRRIVVRRQSAWLICTPFSSAKHER